MCVYAKFAVFSPDGSSFVIDWVRELCSELALAVAAKGRRHDPC
jgi:hypothetical protein